MDLFRIFITSLTLVAAATVTASAQGIITAYETDTARVGVKVGYGGHGLDWETSVDSPVLLFFRFRGSLGQGHWVNWDTVSPPAGTEPLVTRLAASMIVGGPFPPDHVSPPMPDNIRWYFGAGVAAYFPHQVDMNTQRGMRLLFGMDFSGRRWTVSPEIDFDFPHDNTTARPSFMDDFLPSSRIGLAIRRHF